MRLGDDPERERLRHAMGFASQRRHDPPSSRLGGVVTAYRLARENLREDVQLIGRSPALQRLEEEIERSAAVDLPVLVGGEFGVEKLQVACAVHFSGPRRTGPFVEINCLAQAGDAALDGPEEWCERARGGTLFFNRIDELDARLQRRLLVVLDSQIGQWLSAEAPGRRCNVRLVASTANDLDALVDQGRFSRALHAELSFLCIDVPPLRERREDIRPLTEHLLARRGRDPSRDVAEEVFDACEAYAWPENLFELERVVARLHAMVGPGRIGMAELARYAPKVADAWAASRAAAGRLRAAAPAATEPAIAAGETAVAPSRGGAPLPEEEIARRLALGDLSFAAGFHPGLERALRHIAAKYEEPFSLPELARAACVSPSHLSFLFRSELETNFKALLALVRIERAKALLLANEELRITDISLEVGFGDLSHFEKMFKRVVRLNPREFRRRHQPAGEEEPLARGA